MAYSVWDTNVTVNGSIVCHSLTTSQGNGFTDDDIAAGADINHNKLEHRHAIVVSQAGTVGAGLAHQDTYYLRIMRATGTVLSIEAMITETVATGADRTVTLDLKKSTSGGAFASILSSTIVFNNASTIRTLSVGAISDDDLIDGDVLALTVAVAGTAGNQAEGLVVQIEVHEDAA